MTGIIKRITKKLDNYINKVRKIGTGQDYDCIDFKLLDINILKAIYSADGLGKKIIDIKSEDMIREWIDIEKDTDGEILEALNDLNAKSEFLKAIQYNKIYGGSVIFMMIDDGGKAEDELNINNIKSIDKIRAFDRDRFNVLETDDIGEPLLIQINKKDQGVVDVHASRCLIFQGELCLGEFGAFTNMEYWGFSEFQGMFNILGKLGVSLQSIFDMLIKSNIDVLKVDELWEKLSVNNKEGETELDKRLEAFDKGKSISKTLMIDNTEGYEAVSQNYTGVPDILGKMQEFLSLVSGMPATILWGTAPKGLNSTGDNEIRRYYDSIKNKQELTVRNPLSHLIQLLVLSSELKLAQEKCNFEFNPLWQLGEKEEAEFKKITAETDQIYINNGVLDPSEVREARFAGEKYSSDILITGTVEPQEEDDDQSNN